MSATRSLAEFVAATAFGDIPQAVIARSRLAFLDWLGVTLAGSGDDVKGIIRETPVMVRTP